MSHKPLIILSLALTLLISFDYLAAWTVPPSNPPSGNIAAPLNTSGTSQIKVGGLGVGSLDVEGGAIVRGTLASDDLDLTITGRVGAREYCDESGSNCVAGLDLAGGGGGGGIGYGQTWQVVNRTQGVWYQNDTNKPIMVFHKNIWSGSIIDVGVSTTDFVTMNYQDYDSDLDNGSTIIIPPSHYYRFGTKTENNGNGHYVVRELR